MASKLLVTCFLSCLYLQMDLCPAIKVEITPNTFSKLEGTTVDVTCKLNEAEADARTILLMRISRKGERAIVLLHQNNSVTYSAGNADEFRAKGSLKRDIKSSSLQMTILTPDPEDSGMYSCNVYYTNQEGTLIDHKDTDHLTVEDPAVHELNETLKNVQAAVQQNANDIDDMKHKDAEHKAKLSDLEDKLDKQTADIQKLTNKDSDVDKKLEDLKENLNDQIKKIADANKDTADKTKVTELETSVLNQADTIRDLTQKLSEFEKKLSTMKDDIKDKADKKPTTGSGDNVDEDTKNDILNLKESVELHTKTINDLKDTAALNEKGVEKLKGILNVMVANIDKSKTKVTQLDEKLATLKTETNGKIDKLSKEKEDDLGNDLVNLQATVKENTNKIQEATDKAKEATDLANNLKKNTDVLTRQINDVKKGDESNKDSVAFHVTSGVYPIYPTKRKPLKFNEIVLNEGNGIDLKTGIFTAPKAGIYAFFLYLQVPCYGCKLEVTIVVDERIVARFTGGSRYDPDQHSISAVSKLNKGSKAKAFVTYVNKDKKDKAWSLGFLRKGGFSGVLVAAS